MVIGDPWTSIPLSVFLSNYVGVGRSYIIPPSISSKVVSYFPDFFPDFSREDPIKNPDKYKFPYDYLTIDFLMAVYQMEERLILLDMAEREKMSYAKFIDYVINYISCYNDEHGDCFIMSTSMNPLHVIRKKK
jgi:hypothetical protein